MRPSIANDRLSRNAASGRPLQAGRPAGKQGPVRDIITDPEYLDVTVPAGSKFSQAIPQDHTAFAYVIGSQGIFCDLEHPFSYDIEGVDYFDMKRDPCITDGLLVLFGAGDEVAVSTEDDEVRFLPMSGKPILELVAWYGPIVLNTNEELQVAFDEYRKGTFIKHKKA
jgi:quercetin 2,3-dioxygenase